MSKGTAREHTQRESEKSLLLMSGHRAWRLRSRPEGAIKDSDLELCTEPKPAPADGQILVKNMFIRYQTGVCARVPVLAPLGRPDPQLRQRV